MRSNLDRVLSLVPALLLAVSTGFVWSGCGELPEEEDPDMQAPIAEPGIRPTPRPDAGTGGESTSNGKVAVKVSPGRLQGQGPTVGLEGNVTTTFHRTSGVRVGLDITTSATSAQQAR